MSSGDRATVPLRRSLRWARGCVPTTVCSHGRVRSQVGRENGQAVGAAATEHYYSSLRPKDSVDSSTIQQESRGDASPTSCKAVDMMSSRPHAMGAEHGYGIARRIEQISERSADTISHKSISPENPLVQKGWINATWGTSEKNRKDSSTPSQGGTKQLAAKQGLGARFRVIESAADLHRGGLMLTGLRLSCPPPLGIGGLREDPSFAQDESHPELTEDNSAAAWPAKRRRGRRASPSARPARCSPVIVMSAVPALEIFSRNLRFANRLMVRGAVFSTAANPGALPSNWRQHHGFSIITGLNSRLQLRRAEELQSSPGARTAGDGCLRRCSILRGLAIAIAIVKLDRRIHVGAITITHDKAATRSRRRGRGIKANRFDVLGPAAFSDARSGRRGSANAIPSSSSV